MQKAAPLFLMYRQGHQANNAYDDCQTQIDRQVESIGGKTHYLPPIEGCHNIGVSQYAIVHGKQVWLNQDQHGETVSAHLKGWFDYHQFATIAKILQQDNQKLSTLSPGTHAYVVDDYAYVNYQDQCAQSMDNILKTQLKLHPIELELKQENYHLKSCFLPLSEAHALCYLPAFSDNSQAKLQETFDIIPISHHDMVHGVCKSLVLDDIILAPDQCQDAMLDITQVGYHAVPIQTSGLLKIGLGLNDIALRLN